jgi:uncharacterized C2H2 Zn-finger protein
MSQRGSHTWDLTWDYQKCPQCGYIIESREKYIYRLGRYEKELECPRCKKVFTVVKPTKPSWGPLIGDPQPAEVDWS